MFFKGERGNIGQGLASASSRIRHSTTVNNSKLLVRELLGNLIQRCLHQETYRNYQVCYLRCRGKILYIVALRLRLNDFLFETILGLGLLVACVSQVVEAIVIEATNVGNKGHLRLGCSRGTSTSSA